MAQNDDSHGQKWRTSLIITLAKCIISILTYRVSCPEVSLLLRKAVETDKLWKEHGTIEKTTVSYPIPEPKDSNFQPTTEE